MAVKNKLFQMVILCLGIVVVLSCTLISSPEGDQPDSSAMETEIAYRMMATNIAIQQMTLTAIQAQMTLQVPAVQPTQTSEPSQPTIQNIQPSPEPSKTDAPPPAELVLDTQLDFIHLVRSKRHEQSESSGSLSEGVVLFGFQHKTVMSENGAETIKFA